MRYITALNHVSEQNFYRWYPAASRVDNEIRRYSGSTLTAVNRGPFEVAVNRVVSQMLTLP
jgi:hypothetical protein